MTTDFLKYAIDEKADIISAQDVHLTNNKPTTLPRTCVAYDSLSNNCFLIILNNNLQDCCVKKFQNLVFVNLTLRDKELTKSTQHSTQNGDLQQDLENWSEIYQNLQKNVLITGDLNAHSLL